MLSLAEQHGTPEGREPGTRHGFGHGIRDAVELGQQRFQRPHVVVASVFVHQHERVDIGLAQNVFELRLPEVRVDRDEHRADLRERHLE